jgi:hypothetical protein
MAGCIDPNGVALKSSGEKSDAARDCRREQECAASFRRCLENELEFFPKSEIEHLIGLVENNHRKFRQIQIAPLEVVAYAAGRSHDDMGAVGKRSLLPSSIHASDAVGDSRAGVCVEPRQLAADLHRQLARGRDNQGQRR